MKKQGDGGLRESGGTVRFGALAGFGKVKTFEEDSPVQAVAFSPRARRALVGKRKGVSLWELRTGKRLRDFHAEPAAILAVAFSPDGRRGYAACQGKVHCWDLESGEEVSSFANPYQVVVFSHDAGRVLRAMGNTVELHDTQGNLLHSFGPFKGQIRALAISADNRRALVGFGNYLMEDGKPVLRDGKFPTPVDCDVHLLDLDDGRELARLEGHANLLASVCFTPDGRFALSASNRGKVRLWDVRAFRPRPKKTAPGGGIKAAGGNTKGPK
jgi:WD40 repeat protein